MEAPVSEKKTPVSQPGRDRVQTVISAAEKPLSGETADDTKVRISSNSVRRASGGICPSYVNLSDKSESKEVAKESIRNETRLFDKKLRMLDPLSEPS